MENIACAPKFNAEAAAPPAAPANDGDAAKPAKPLFQYANCAYVGWLAFILLLLTVAIHIRIPSNHERSIHLELLYGTPEQLHVCANLSNPRDAGCSVQNYHVDTNSSNSVHMAILRAAAVITVAVLVSIMFETTHDAIMGRKTTGWRPLQQMGLKCRYIRLIYLVYVAICSFVWGLLNLVCWQNFLTLQHTFLSFTTAMLSSFYLIVGMSAAWLLAILDLHE